VKQSRREDRGLKLDVSRWVDFDDIHAHERPPAAVQEIEDLP